MKIRIKLVLAICLSAVTVLLLAITMYRWMLDYNENGVHFNEDTATTYDNGAVVGYGTLAVIFLIPTIVFVKRLCEPLNRKS